MGTLKTIGLIILPVMALNFGAVAQAVDPTNCASARADLGDRFRDEIVELQRRYRSALLYSDKIFSSESSVALAAVQKEWLAQFDAIQKKRPLRPDHNKNFTLNQEINGQIEAAREAHRLKQYRLLENLRTENAARKALIKNQFDSNYERVQSRYEALIQNCGRSG